MKTKVRILSCISFIVFLVFLVYGFSLLTVKKYYYTYNDKEYLSEISNTFIIRYIENKHSEIDNLSLNTYFKNQNIQWIDDSTVIIKINDKSAKELTKAKIIEQKDVKSCQPLYTTNSYDELGITDEIIIKFYDSINLKDIEKIHRKFNVEIVETNNLFQLIRVPKYLDALTVANAYQESGLTRYSIPNFISKLIFNSIIPNDTYFTNQFYLNNTGQVFTDGHSGTADADIDAPEAWTFTQGNSNIIIAVIDQGVTSNHPDLPNTRQLRLNNSNISGDGDPNDPSPSGNDNHGNACAGIIAATQNNSQGISGIAPNCIIMPIKSAWSGGTISASKLVTAIELARTNGADIISNSWSLNSTNPDYWPPVVDAISTAASYQGRNGRGCIIVFATGNTARHSNGQNGTVLFPANVNVSGVLTVGSSDRYDNQADYSPTTDLNSPYNQVVDLVAPSNRSFSGYITGETYEVWTTDTPGDAGDNSVHHTDGGTLPTIGEVLPNSGTNYLSYTGRYGGTSASEPQVAAVAALILSINYDLHQQSVFNIITNTADKVGGYTYTSGNCLELGYGRLNACAAVRYTYSITTTISGPYLLCNSETYTLSNVPTEASVYWTSSWNISRYSPQYSSPSCIFQKYANGDGWINAQITTDCGVVNITKQIHTGPYSSSNYPISGPSSAQCNSWVSFSIPQLEGVTSINWTWPQGWTYSSGQGTRYLALITGQYSGVVGVGVNNTCGPCGSYYTKYVNVYGYCGYGFSMYPNPASEEVTIAINEPNTIFTEDADISEVVVSKAMPSDQITYTIYIYTSLGTLVSTTKRTGTSFNIPLLNLRDGTYIVELNDGINSIREPLIIKHD